MSQLKKLKRKVLLNLVNLYCDGTKWAKVNKQRFAISGLKPYKQGIQEWKQMWGGLLVKPNPLYYHLFGNYVHESKYIIPENVSHIVVEAILNPREYRFFYDDKNSFDSIFPEGFLPRTILQNIGGDFVHKNTPPHSIDEEAFQALLNSTDHHSVIIKPAVSSGGKGIHFARKEANGWFIVGQEKPTPFTLSYLQKTYGKDYIIQEVLQQSDELAQFNETSLNTLRVCVYKSVKTNECHVTGAAIRMGARGSLVDNVSSGGIFAGVSLDGTVAHCAFDKMGRRYTTFNGVDFTQPHKISNFQKVIEFALEVGKRVHNMHLIDLDIAIDKAGNPRLLEFNVSGFGMWLYHYTGVAPFGVFTEEILDYCRQNIGKIWYRIRL